MTVVPLSLALSLPLAAALPQQGAPPAPPPSAAQAVAAPALDSARGAMQAGRVEDAVRYAERYSSRNPRDARGYMTLGDAYMLRRPTGRFNALRAYEEAMRLAPGDPEPPYLYAQAGMFLGGDDGEAIARLGLERALSFDPMFRDAWDQWLLLFRNEGARRRMRDLLGAHAARPEVRARLALLFLEDERYAEADSLLDELLAHDSTNVEWLAWRAQGAYEAGDTAAGGRFYRRALGHAALDSTGALWRQALGIARPDEVRAYESVADQRRGAWFEAFWARRSPDLFRGSDGRLAEHFARLRQARRSFPLLHPLVSFHRSQLSRTLALDPARGERDFFSRCEMDEAPVPPDATAWRARAETDAEADAWNVPPAFRALFAPLSIDPRSPDAGAARIGYNLATGLDDRGVLYLRFGPPDQSVIGGRNDADPLCRTRDVERWRYDALGELRFARPRALAAGHRAGSEMLIRPMTARQLDAVRGALVNDAPSERATLPFGVWTAQFASGRPGAANVVVVSTRGQLAGMLVSQERGAGAVRRGAGGVVVLEAEPGPYLLVAHTRDSARLGRQELALPARSFLRRPGLSDLLLAPAWSAPGATFGDMLRRVQRDLVFATGSTIRSYAEVYGLEPVAGAVRYRADYLVLETDDFRRDAAREEWPGAVRLSFERVVPAAGVVREMLDLTPEQLPPGSYLLRLTVRDLVGGEEAGRATIGFLVR